MQTNSVFLWKGTVIPTLHQRIGIDNNWKHIYLYTSIPPIITTTQFQLLLQSTCGSSATAFFITTTHFRLLLQSICGSSDTAFFITTTHFRLSFRSTNQ